MTTRSRARLATVTVLALAAALLTAPAPAAATVGPCEVSGPGSTVCTGTVTFSSYALSTVFAPFQGFGFGGPQPDIAVSFSQPVDVVRVIANDPDFAGTRAMIHYVGAFTLTPLNATVDNQTGVFTVSTQTTLGPIDYLVLESDNSDYVNWRVEYVRNFSGWCVVNQPFQPCLAAGTSASVTPYAAAMVFNPFQATPGTGAQPPIDVTFAQDQIAVAATAVDPDFAGSQLEAYSANGTLLAVASFGFDSQPGEWSTSTRSISGVGLIRRVRLVSAANDYVAFQGLTVTAP